MKEQTAVNRKLINKIKDKHSEILAMEEKIQWVTDIIKKKKAEGLTPEESKRREEAKLTLVQN